MWVEAGVSRRGGGTISLLASSGSQTIKQAHSSTLFLSIIFPPPNEHIQPNHSPNMAPPPDFDNGPATFDYTPPAALLTGRIAIVTGANIGLGLETAIQLARLDPKLIVLAVRSLEKGEAAKREIAEKSGLAEERVVVRALDMASFAR